MWTVLHQIVDNKLLPAPPLKGLPRSYKPVKTLTTNSSTDFIGQKSNSVDMEGLVGIVPDRLGVMLLTGQPTSPHRAGSEWL
jgi:hypothetical protein